MEQVKAELLRLQSKHRERRDFIDRSFPQQAAFLDDKSQHAVAFCTRRAGKSYSAASFMYECSEAHPGSSVLYLGLTRDSAKRVMWKDCIIPMEYKYQIGSKPHGTELSMTRDNGSVLYFAGADSNSTEMAKLLGQKYSGVFIDEAQSWKQDLQKLIFETLGPAVADYRGKIRLGGTPSNRVGTFFHKVTTGEIPGWSIHRWSADDNPYMRENWRAEIASLKREFPGIEKTAGFRQNYLGEWVIEDSARVYRFTRSRNMASIPGPHRLDEDQWVLGVDLGYSPDPTAFVLCSYRQFDKRLFIHRTEKKKEMTISDVAERLQIFLKEFPQVRIVMDAANKQAVEEMRIRHGIGIIAAEKHGKEAYIAHMNSDFERGTITLSPDCESLAKEYEELVWDEDTKMGSVRKEDPACDNHLTDAALYAWRWSFNYAWENAPKDAPIHSEEKVDEFWQREAEKLENEKQGGDPFGY